MYFIAYKDQDGNDLNGLPWIEPVNTDEERIELPMALAVKKSFSDIFQTVVLFKADVENMPEEVTWEFVEQHKIEEHD